MQARGAQQGADGHVPVGNVQMQLVADPAFLVTGSLVLGVTVQKHGSTAIFASNGRSNCSSRRLGGGGWCPSPLGRPSALVAARAPAPAAWARASRQLDGRRITAEMPDEFGLRVREDDALMHALREMAAGELLKSPRKGRLRRHLARVRKPAQAAQGGLAAQHVDEGGSRGTLIHALGRKRMHEPEAFAQ